jgi:hypothetical protein
MIRSIWREVSTVLLLTAGFTVTVWLALAMLGRPFHPWSAFAIFAPPYAFAAGLYFAVAAAVHPQGLPGPAVKVRLASGVVLSLAFLAMLGAFASQKQAIGQIVGLPWDGPLAAIDQALHGGVLPWRWTWPLFSDGAIVLIDRLYGAWGVVSLGFTTWLTWTWHPLRHQARVAWLLLWIGAGTMAAWGFASGGPVALDASSAYGPWLDRLYAVPGLMTTEMHAALLETYRTGQFVPFGGISAMPSMHVGGIVLVAIVAWRRWRPLGAACWGYAGVIQIGSVVLGWHYAIDGYAGALLAWGCWRIAGRWRDARAGVDSQKCP